jgi:hypothetical protein
MKAWKDSLARLAITVAAALNKPTVLGAREGLHHYW